MNTAVPKYKENAFVKCLGDYSNDKKRKEKKISHKDLV